MKKPILAAFIVIIIAVIIFFSFYFKNNTTLSPVSLLLETSFEEIQRAFIKNPQDKIESDLSLIKKRIKEVDQLVLKNKTDKIDPYLLKIPKYLERIKKNIEEQKEENNKIGDLAINTDNELKEITSLLNNIEIKISYSSGKRILIEETITKVKNTQKEILDIAYSGEEKGPKLTFIEEEYNFGNIKKGEIVEHNFEFTNTGGYDLIIEDIYASCGCTASVIDTKTIKPGEKGNIKVTFDTTYKKGDQTQKVTITSNDYQEKYKYLIIKAHVEE